MKKIPYYGFPLNRIILRLIFSWVIIIFLIFFIILPFPLFFLFIYVIFIGPMFVYFGMFRFKQDFEKERQIILGKMIMISNIVGKELVLDLGTGSGFLAIGFSKNLTEGKVYGIDKYNIKNPHKIKVIHDIIKTNFIGNSLDNAIGNAKIENVDKICKFKIADFTKVMDFPNNYFDIIMSCQSLYCSSTSEQQTLFSEIDRILKKGGKIIFFEKRILQSFLKRKTLWSIINSRRYYEKKGYLIHPDMKLFNDNYICFYEKI